MYADKRTYSGGTPLTTSFAETAASILFSSTPAGGTLAIINTTSDVIAVVFGSYKVGETPDSTLPGRCYLVPAAPTGGSGALLIDLAQISKGNKVYVRAVNTEQTSGSIYAFIK